VTRVSLHKWLGALVFSMSLSLAASTPQRSPLPAEFAPIRWDTDPTRLGELFPGAELDQTEYGGTLGQPRRKQFGASVERPVLGAAGIIIVTAAESGKIESVKVVTAERRPECSPIGALGAPRSCRWRYSRSLVDIFKRMRETLSARYGPGVAKPDPKEPRARYVQWRLGGYRLYLALDRGEEEGDWSVSLTAWADASSSQ
jgi:hypothetical protein